MRLIALLSFLCGLVLVATGQYDFLLLSIFGLGLWVMDIWSVIEERREEIARNQRKKPVGVFTYVAQDLIAYFSPHQCRKCGNRVWQWQRKYIGDHAVTITYYDQHESCPK